MAMSSLHLGAAETFAAPRILASAPQPNCRVVSSMSSPQGTSWLISQCSNLRQLKEEVAHPIAAILVVLELQAFPRSLVDLEEAVGKGLEDGVVGEAGMGLVCQQPRARTQLELLVVKRQALLPRMLSFSVLGGCLVEDVLHPSKGYWKRSHK